MESADATQRVHSTTSLAHCGAERFVGRRILHPCLNLLSWVFAQLVFHEREPPVDDA